MIRPVEPVRHTPRSPAGARQTVETASTDGTGRNERTGRSLAVVAPAARRQDPPRATVRRPDAAFLAHIAAIEAGDPQTRTRRQVTPDFGAQRYAEAMLRPQTAPRRSGAGVVL